MRRGRFSVTVARVKAILPARSAFCGRRHSQEGFVAYIDDWKKVKPKTFDDKLLLTSFKELDRAKGLWEKDANRVNLMALSGASKNVLRAAEQAAKALGRDPKAGPWLDKTVKMLDAGVKQATVLQRDMVAFHQKTDQGLGLLGKSLQTLAKKPSQADLKKLRGLHKQLSDWFMKSSTLYQSPLVDELGKLLQTAGRALDRLAAQYDVEPASGSKDAKDWQQSIDAVAAGIGEFGKKLAARGDQGIKVKQPKAQVKV
jgi:hypothetical protein